MGFTGDYLFRDGRNPFFEGGLWGILRVVPKSEAPRLRLDLMGAQSVVAIDLRTGATEEALSATSPDGICTVRLAQGTRLTGPQSTPVSDVNAHWNVNPPPAPAGAEVALAIDLHPKLAAIAPEAKLVIRYQPSRLPSGADESSLFIAEWDTGSWKEVPSTVDAIAQTVTAELDGLETYALMVRRPASEPATGPASPISPPPPATPIDRSYWGWIGILLAAAAAAGLVVSFARGKPVDQ